MKKVVILAILIIFITSCVPEPEEIAGVTREELENGRAVEKALTIKKPELPSFEEPEQTLEQAHEKEIIDVAEHSWNGMRPRTFDDGAIEASVGQTFKVSVK